MDIDDALIASAALDDDCSEAGGKAGKSAAIFLVILIGLCVACAVWYNTADWRVEHLPAAFSTKSEKQSVELRHSLDEIGERIKALAR